ncbi:MAG: hypothetical protein PHQ42_01730 [Patescibacteria group bacterium]|nr:hypothetical protein [Patescibacteria group bacterium]
MGVIFLVLILAIIAHGRFGRKPKMPKFIKSLRSHNPWHIVFFDKRPWLKSILILLLKGIAWLFLIIWRAFAFGLRLVSPKWLKKIKEV